MRRQVSSAVGTLHLGARTVRSPAVTTATTAHTGAPLPAPARIARAGAGDAQSEDCADPHARLVRFRLRPPRRNPGGRHGRGHNLLPERRERSRLRSACPQALSDVFLVSRSDARAAVPRRGPPGQEPAMTIAEEISQYLQWRKSLTEGDYPVIWERLKELEVLREQSDSVERAG